ncbi:uncharacterized protein LOC129237025 [Anastrepha obliqua]|uniref:uncharacterized protein LOC129237025 n=1 Tax=Anastrepha obliqua TaxID=95512 RepID=UPI0024094B3D|nr:uncharacterized protein LOC129237025 [Anastrepha obliqua]
MGHLPADRVQQTYPFEVTGVDYCGPVLITQRIRGRSPIKSYIAVFICFVTKAVHLEVVPNLSTQAFISTLKRFIARRGKSRKIVSNNATNFVGANRELRQLLSAFVTKEHVEEVQRTCLENEIEWQFIPPRSPHFGGLWESAVKLAKYFLRRAIGTTTLTLDELQTVCCQSEAIINSRPLTPMSTDANDMRPLTPAHFLIGRPLTTIPDSNSLGRNDNLLKRYQIVQQIHQSFWERWHCEYLKNLQQRTKWKTESQNLQTNDMVLIKEENTPPLKWTTGRITEVKPGDDGRVRVVVVKTRNGLQTRAISKICKLPV